VVEAVEDQVGAVEGVLGGGQLERVAGEAADHHGPPTAAVEAA
jgi:hypothetical protein